MEGHGFNRRSLMRLYNKAWHYYRPSPTTIYKWDQTCGRKRDVNGHEGIRTATWLLRRMMIWSGNRAVTLRSTPTGDAILPR